ncbi:FkbM family methyltransferase [Bradyrhizobium macuxiense]|nr:FkbM family methyltransferase [Bradyrhizobium macuxiense]
MATNDLIYDVGVNDGVDSAYYLSRGYRVLGIEASPVLAAKLREKFEPDIREGRYTLLEVGVADDDGSAEFWMSDVTEWSSFNKDVASRDGTPHRAVHIATRRFSSIVEEFGVPFYCKVDIEGNDRCCVRALTEETAPPYLSIEMSHKDGGVDLNLLDALGYRHFKIISQVTRAQPVPSLMKIDGMLSGFPKKALRAAIKRTLGVRSSHGRKFPLGSSGPFAEGTPGRWRSVSDVRGLWAFLKEFDERTGKNRLGEWFDFHAKR